MLIIILNISIMKKNNMKKNTSIFIILGIVAFACAQLQSNQAKIEEEKIMEKIRAEVGAEEISDSDFMKALAIQAATILAVVMIEQFRVGVVKSHSSPWLLEVVAGIIEPDDPTSAAVVQRETQEETGLEILDLEHIHDYWVSPGSSSEQMNLFCARVDASNANGVHGNKHEGEDIKLHVFDIADIFDGLKQQRFNNSMTIIALQWLQINHQQLKHKWSKR